MLTKSFLSIFLFVFAFSCANCLFSLAISCLSAAFFSEVAQRVCHIANVKKPEDFFYSYISGQKRVEKTQKNLNTTRKWLFICRTRTDRAEIFTAS